MRPLLQLLQRVQRCPSIAPARTVASRAEPFNHRRDHTHRHRNPSPVALRLSSPLLASIAHSPRLMSADIRTATTTATGIAAGAETAAVSAGGGGTPTAADAAARVFNVAVLTPPNNVAFETVPTVPGVQLTLGNAASDFTGARMPERGFDAVLYMLGASPQGLMDLWPHIRHSCRWVHSFSAGVDVLVPFFREHFVRDGVLINRDVTVTNGKGAFSDSLAE
jgi:hypothetical protein